MMTAEYYKPGDIVIFCDTGREHEGTYKFVDDFERIEGIRIERVIGFDFSSYIKEKKKVPNIKMRWCTVEAKIKPARKFLIELGIKEYLNFIGFRFDEKSRIVSHVERYKNVKTIFPLFKYGIDKQFVLDYWNKKSYNLEIPQILGNCDACFMKGKGAIIRIYQQFPELANKWIEDENSANGHTYIKGISHQKMLDIATELNLKNSGCDIEKLKPEFNCSCGA